LTKVVGRGTPFQRTVEPAVKFEPFTDRVKADPPAVAVEGLRPLITAPPGGGGAVPAVIVKTDPFDATPLVLTVTVAVPWEVIRPAATEAVN